MEVYVALIIVSTFLSLIASRFSENAQKRITVTIFGALAIVSGFRGMDVGTDTATYYHVFLNISAYPNLLDAISYCGVSAPAYVAENWLISMLGGDYRVVLLVNSFIICALSARFVLKTSDNPILSALCFLLLAIFFQSMNGMRQYVAIALAMNAFVDFYGTRTARARSLVLFALAIMVHSTAMICLVGFACVFIVNKCRNRKKAVLFLIVGSLVISAGIPLLVSIFTQIFPYYSMYDGTTNIDIFSNNYGGRIALLYVLLLLVCAVDYFTATEKSTASVARSQRGKDIGVICVIAAVIGLCFSQNFLMTRLLWFYLFPYISYIPNTISKIRGGLSVLVAEVVLAGLLVWCVLQMIENKDDVIPYVFSLFVY